MAVSVAGGSAAAYLPEPGAHSVFGDHIPIIAGQGGPRGRADVEGHGYRLAGRWSYGSGLLHAEYIHTGAMVYRGGKPVGPRTFIVPVEHARITGNWDVIGLRATGSVDYTLDNVYVPEEFTHSPAAIVPLRGGDIGRIGIAGMSPLGHGSFALGVGRRILDELRALANASGGKPSALVDGTGETFEQGYGAAEGKLRAGRAFFYEACADMQATL
jgi:alkylation response protein AidB-like acyl-CoA dehydrogenase